MTIQAAREALKRAEDQLAKVQTASVDPPDAEDAVMWAFYAYENCIVAAAYGPPSSELEEANLEELASELESFVTEVRALLEKYERGRDTR